MINAGNVLDFLINSKPKLMTDEELDFYLIGEGPAYLGFFGGVGLILDADGSVATFDANDDECIFTWFNVRKIT